MVGWHHRLDAHEFEQTPGDGEGQGSPRAAVPRVTESDTTEQPYNKLIIQRGKAETYRFHGADPFHDDYKCIVNK